MIKLKKDETLKEYWQTRNGLRLKLQSIDKSFEEEQIESYVTAEELMRIRDLKMLSSLLLTKWGDNKPIIDRALKVNA